MLKQLISVTLSMMLFTAGSVMAEHHKSDDNDAHKGMEHPAHEMGEAAADKDTSEQHSQKYKENLKAAEESKHQPHPAHEMGEGE